MSADAGPTSASVSHHFERGKLLNIHRLRSRAVKYLGLLGAVSAGAVMSACCGITTPLGLCCSGAECLTGLATVAPAAVAQAPADDVDLPSCMAGDDDANCVARAEVAY